MTTGIPVVSDLAPRTSPRFPPDAKLKLDIAAAEGVALAAAIFFVGSTKPQLGTIRFDEVPCQCTGFLKPCGFDVSGGANVIVL